MNIVIVNHYAGSPFHGMEYRPYLLAREWVRAGHKVTVVAASFSHLRPYQPKCPEPITSEMIDDIQYLWLRTPGYYGNGFKRVLNMLSFAGRLYIMPLPIEAPDVVIDSSTYPLTVYGSGRIARKYGCKLIFEVHDLWPLSPLELGGYPRWHPFIVVMQYAENYAYRNAHRVVSLLPKAREHMVHHGMSSEKFIYIPNGIHVSSWRLSDSLPEKHAKLLGKLKRDGKFIIAYTGAHGVANALQHLVKAAGILREHSEIHFILVGQGPEKETLKALAKYADLANVSFLPPIFKSAIPTLLSYMDAVYIGLKRNPLFRFGVCPNKLMDYMMAGKPIISAIEAGNDMVRDSGCGISIFAEDPHAIADAILNLSELSREQREEMGRRGHEYVKSHHDYAVLAKRFIEGIVIDRPNA